MKRIAVVVAALSVLLPVLPVRAATLHQSVRINESALPQLTHVANDDLFESLEAGDISTGNYALQRARSLFELGAVRSDFGAVARPDARVATFLMRDLSLRLDTLSGEDRAAAEALLARPTQGAADPDNTGYTVSEAAPVCSANVCVHYVSSTRDAATSSFVAQVSAVMEHVWTTEISTYGWREPVSDVNLPHNEGSGKFDVYLSDLGRDGIYGFCTPDPGQRTVAESAYCVLDNDFSFSQFGAEPVDSLSVTTAHEFNHAIQFAYDVTDDMWLLEATATFMEDEVYDDINDNYQYLVTGPLGRPRTPADSFSDFQNIGPDSGYQYGTFVWMRYLSEEFGSRDVVRRIWEKVDGRGAPDGGLYSLQGIAAMLSEQGTDFASSFADFAAKNAKPSAFYEEGTAYENEVAPVRNVRKTLSTSETSTIGTFSNVDHLTTRYVSFKPGADVGPSDNITIAVNLDDATGTQRATVVNLVGNSATYTPVTVDSHGQGAATVPFGGQSEVVLALTNASDRFSNCRGSRAAGFSCGGTPLDDNQAYAYSAALGDTAVDPGDPGSGGGGTTKIITRLSDSPDPFHPGGGRKVKIKFTVATDCVTTLRLYRPNGRLLGVLVPKQKTSAGSWFVTWLGNDTGGRFVPGGKYRYKVTSIDLTGARDTASGAITIRR